jgi:UPF0755 protein
MKFKEQFQLDGAKLSKGKIIRLALAVLLLLLAAAIIFIRIKIDSPFAQGSNQVFVINPGEPSKIISASLYAQGLISSPWVFDIYASLSGKAVKIEAGQYVLSPSMTMKEILDQLVNGKVKADINVVQIKEGWTLTDIENYLQQNNIAQKADFEAAQAGLANQGLFGESLKDKNLEGYIFPDTYFIKKGSSSNEVITKALANLEQKLSPQMRADILAQHKTIYEILTMASIVEKEVGRHTTHLSDMDLTELAYERKVVAGIFYRRIQIGMPLQSDATISYITKEKNPSATFADLKIDSPYNTYKYQGLPPGPISNPSLSSIEAAIYPNLTDYLYFLIKPYGTAVFAKTLQEQNQNKAEFLK